MGRLNKLLVIDDESELRELLVYYLELEGFELCQAANGDEALNKLPIFQPHFILCDVRMPICDGFEFIQKIQNTNFNNIPIFFMSAFVGNELDGLKKYPNCAKIFLKPLEMDKVISFLKNVDA